MDGYYKRSPDNRLYRIYKGMKTRCYNQNAPEYYIYGGKGIKICDQWMRDYNNFCEWALEHGYNDSLSIDRIDNDSNYCPENCRWATAYQQMRNTSRNRFLKIGDEEKTVSEWCDLYHINLHTFYGRLREGWPVEDALCVPSKGKRNLDFEYQGVTKSIPQWAKEYGMGATTLKYRLFAGWPIDKALTTPVKSRR